MENEAVLLAEIETIQNSRSNLNPCVGIRRSENEFKETHPRNGSAHTGYKEKGFDLLIDQSLLSTFAKLDYFPETLTVKRLRPFARRRRMTFLPVAVSMRARNPWRRRRLVRLGCRVRFITTPKGD